MEEVNKILVLYEQGNSIGKIAKKLNRSKSTIKIYVDRIKGSGLTLESAKAKSQEELAEELIPKKRQMLDYLEPVWEEIYLEHNKRRGGKNLKQLWEEYCEKGCKEGAKVVVYQSFCRLYEKFKSSLPEHLKEVSMHFNWAPGEVSMIDYAGDKLFIQDSNTGKKEGVNLFVSVLANSGYIYCVATKTQQRDEWLDSISKMFEFYGGVTEYIYLDNSTALVNKADRYNPKVSPLFNDLCEHYGTTPFVVAPGEPTHKGLVENAVKQCTREIIIPLNRRVFFDLESLNIEIMKLLDNFNNKAMVDYGGMSRYERYKEEKNFLQKLPMNRYEPSQEIKTLKVRKEYHIRYNGCRYSVPYSYIGKMVKLIVYPRKGYMEIWDIETGEKITKHELRKKGYATRKEHMPEAHKEVVAGVEEKIGKLRNIGISSRLFIDEIMKEKERIAHRYIRGLFKSYKYMGEDSFEDCCRSVIEKGVISYDKFEEEKLKICECLNRIKKKLGHGTSLEEIRSTENIRGENYYNQEGEEK